MAMITRMACWRDVRSIAAVGLAAILMGAAPPLRAQSCPAADAAIGVSKSKPKFKSSYDKFADTTTLSTKEGVFQFKTSNVFMGASVDLKHAGIADGPLSAQLHLRGALWWDRGVPQPIPAVFSDSAVLTILADTARMTLRASGHNAPRPLSLVTTSEDLFFAMTPMQLETLARAKSGALRLVDMGSTYDMAVVGQLAQDVAMAYRTIACSPRDARIAGSASTGDR